MPLINQPHNQIQTKGLLHELLHEHMGLPIIGLLNSHSPPPAYSQCNAKGQYSSFRSPSISHRFVMICLYCCFTESNLIVGYTFKSQGIIPLGRSKLVSHLGKLYGKCSFLAPFSVLMQ